MTEFHRVTPHFAVAGQLELSDIARAAEEGFSVLVCNRPEGEDAGQPTQAAIIAAATAAGMTFRSLPYAGPTPPGIVGETAELLEENAGKSVLAYCRTGKRSIMAWALAQALSGAERADEIIALASKAGYDLEGARVALETLAPRT